MKKSHKYTNVIIKLLLMLSIMLAALTIFINSFVLNKNTYINMFDKDGTYTKITESIYSKIDSALSAKNINYDIKESLITEDDIKREADAAITGLIEYLKTGQNNMPAVDTTVYKKRVSDILKSFVGNNSLLSENTSQDEKINLASNETVFNNQLQSKNLSYTGDQVVSQNLEQVQDKFVPENMIYVQKVSNTDCSNIVVEKLASRSEIEDQIRKKLAEKGISEDQARQMLKDRGISEEQAWKMLEGQGVVPDEDKNSQQDNSTSQKESSDTNNSTSNSDQNSSSSQDAAADDQSKEDKAISSSNDNIKDKLGSIPDGAKSLIQNQLNDMINTLADEAGNIIDKEVEKMNLNNLMNSNKIQKIAQITSIFYKMRWVFMMMPIVLAIVLGLLEKNIGSSIKWIGIGFMFTGVLLLGMSLGGNIFNIYDKININTVYLKDIVCNIVQHFLMILLNSGIITFVLGIILLIPKIKRYLKNKKYQNI